MNLINLFLLFHLLTGNFICDIMLASTHSDLAILNSGTLRADRIYTKGDFTLRDLVTLLPMMDPMIVLNATGNLC